MNYLHCSDSLAKLGCPYYAEKEKKFVVYFFSPLEKIFVHTTSKLLLVNEWEKESRAKQVNVNSLLIKTLAVA